MFEPFVKGRRYEQEPRIGYSRFRHKVPIRD